MLRKDTINSPIICTLLCHDMYAHYPVVSHTVAHKNARGDREISLLLGSSCCENICFRKLSFMDVKSSEEWATEKSGSEMRSWIISYLEQHAKEGGSPVFFIHGIEVCKVCWRRTYNIKYDRLRKVMKDFRNGVKVYHHGNKGKRQLRVKASSTMAWMKFFIGAIGDQQPDSNRIHLPSCFTRISVYQKMKVELEQFNEECVSQTHFYRMWSEHFRHVIIPKVNHYKDPTMHKFFLQVFLTDILWMNIKCHHWDASRYYYNDDKVAALCTATVIDIKTMCSRKADLRSAVIVVSTNAFWNPPWSNLDGSRSRKALKNIVILFCK